MTDERFFAVLAKRGLHFTPEQRRAVTHGEGAAVVFAGPGSGKTTVIAARTLYLHRVAGVPASRIVVFTFTRKSAAELATRLRRLAPTLGSVAAGTFHSLFLRWLMRHTRFNPRLLTIGEQRQIAFRALKSARLVASEEEVGRLLQTVTRLKSGGRPFEPSAARAPDQALYRKAYEEYERIKAESERADFDDILLYFREAVQKDPSFLKSVLEPGTHIMVDEFQDTNPVQWQALTALGGRSSSFLAVGDDDQSIYGFRGAQGDIFKTFAREYPTAAIIVLRHNFRSTDPVIRFADQIVAKIPGRRAKGLIGTRGDGSRVRLVTHADEWAEARWVAREVKRWTAEMADHGRRPHMIGVLARTNRQLLTVTDALQKAGIEFVAEDGGTWMTDFHARAAMAVMEAAYVSASNARRPTPGAETVRVERALALVSQWLQNGALDPPSRWLQSRHRSPDDHSAHVWLRGLLALTPGDAANAVLESYLAYRRRFTGADDVAEIEGVLRLFAKNAAEFDAWESWRAALDGATGRAEARTGLGSVRIHTFHGAKGLEFDGVILVGVHDRAVPHPRALRDAVKGVRTTVEAEERRLLYVACTRARDWLCISYARSVNREVVKVSPFLETFVQHERPSPRSKNDLQLKFSGRNGGSFAAGSVPVGLPDRGDFVRHRIFGVGTVDSVEQMQENGHKIGVWFAGSDLRYFHWELAAQSGHFVRESPHRDEEGEQG